MCISIFLFIQIAIGSPIVGSADISDSDAYDDGLSSALDIAADGGNIAATLDGGRSELVTNRRWILSDNSTLEAVVQEDVMPPQRRPNIIIMMADNLGWGDLGCYGGGELRGAPTPCLDQMAAEGLRLTSFYTETQCTPTRAATMTGRLPIRTGMSLALIPGTGAGMSPNEVTIAKVLSDAGYDTACYGKWHLGDSNDSMPQNMGFDEYWGTLYYLQAYVAPEKIGYDTAVLPPLMGIVEAKKGENFTAVGPINSGTLPYIDEQIANKAVAYIEDHANSDRPFFLYLPWTRVHIPDIPHPDWKGKSRIGDYGDALMELDFHSGMVLDAVREAGIENDTVVVFFSDNGPTKLAMPDTGYTPFRGEIATGWDGGIRNPCIFWWPSAIEAGHVSNEIVCSLDLFNTFANIGGGSVPTDRPIDGVDQTEFILGRENHSNREHVLIFIGSDLAAIRWRQFKIHFETYETMESEAVDYSEMPAIYNTELDPQESVNIASENDWLFQIVYRYLQEVQESFIEYPNAKPHYDWLP